MTTTTPVLEHILLKDNAPAPLGNYSHAVRAGDFIYLCGMGARDAKLGTEVGVTLDDAGSVTAYDMTVQTRAVIENMKTVLNVAGASLADVIDVSVFLEDMNDFPEMNAVYAEYFNFENLPVRTTVQAKPPGLNFVEMKAIAYKPLQAN